MSNHLPYIEHTHETGTGIITKFTCRGDRSSPCHMRPDCDCAFLMEDCTHVFTQHNECWVEWWMTDADCAELCGPDGEHVRSGPISVTFDGDCVGWEYADEKNDQ